MREVIERATAKAVEVIVAALQWTIVGKPAEVPFADQCRAVSGPFEQRRKRRMTWRQANIARRTGQRLLETDWKTVLVAAGDKSDARSSADGGVGIRLSKLHAGCSEAIDVRRHVIGTAVAGHIRVAKV